MTDPTTCSICGKASPFVAGVSPAETCPREWPTLPIDPQYAKLIGERDCYRLGFERLERENAEMEKTERNLLAEVERLERTKDQGSTEEP